MTTIHVHDIGDDETYCGELASSRSSTTKASGATCLPCLDELTTRARIAEVSREKWAAGTVARTVAHRQQVQDEGDAADDVLRARGYPLPDGQPPRQVTCSHDEKMITRVVLSRDDGELTGAVRLRCGGCDHPFRWENVTATGDGLEITGRIVLAGRTIGEP